MLYCAVFGGGGDTQALRRFGQHSSADSDSGTTPTTTFSDNGNARHREKFLILVDEWITHHSR